MLEKSLVVNWDDRRGRYRCFQGGKADAAALLRRASRGDNLLAFSQIELGSSKP